MRWGRHLDRCRLQELYQFFAQAQLVIPLSAHGDHQGTEHWRTTLRQPNFLSLDNLNKLGSLDVAYFDEFAIEQKQVRGAEGKRSGEYLPLDESRCDGGRPAFRNITTKV